MSNWEQHWSALSNTSRQPPAGCCYIIKRLAALAGRPKGNMALGLRHGVLQVIMRADRAFALDAPPGPGVNQRHDTDSRGNVQGFGPRSVLAHQWRQGKG